MEREAILLVESCDDDVFFFKRALEQLGMENAVIVVSSVSEAIALLRGETQEGGPRLLAVVMELHLLGDDAFGLLRWIREQRQLDNLPVIVLTASIREQDFERAREFGANEVFAKTCNPDELQTVAAHIRGLAWQHAALAPELQSACPGGRRQNASELLAALAARLK